MVIIPRFSSLNFGADDEGVSGGGSGKDTRHPSLASQESHSTATSEGSVTDDHFPLKVRGGSMKRPAGYQVGCMFVLLAF